MSADPNKKSARTFQCRDVLWETFEQMARELECSIDYLINESMKQYARQRSYSPSPSPGPRTPFPGQQFQGGQPPQQQGMPMPPPGMPQQPPMPPQMPGGYGAPPPQYGQQQYGAVRRWGASGGPRAEWLRSCSPAEVQQR